jgi:uncharacterized protein DUF6544
MATVLVLLLAAHGLIHLLGFAKAFQLADLPQLTQPISPLAGALWFVSALLFLAAAGSLFITARAWWAIAACALVVSVAVIFTSWNDAKFGLLPNLVVLAATVFGFLTQGPKSLRAEYDGDTDRGLARSVEAQSVTDADLAHLPEPLQRYLRASGVVGLPRVHNFHARMHGRIRSGRDAPWMPFSAEQYNFVDEPARLFYLNASMYAVPVQGYHRYVGSSAAMRVKAAGLVRVVDAAGDEMTSAETVTMFNDMCVLAPATLIDPAIVWEPVDQRIARAAFTNAGRRIRAELSVNEAGELIDFRSDDRYETAPDGSGARRVRWSTPIGAYRAFGPVRLASRGEGRWHGPEGEYAYIELTIDEVRYNVGRR